MIEVGDKIRYFAIEGRYHDSSGNPAGGTQMNVIAWVTGVSEGELIDIAWRGDSGYHPDTRPDLELHVRTGVALIGYVPAEIHPVLAGRLPEFCNHDGTRAFTQWERI